MIGVPPHRSEPDSSFDDPRAAGRGLHSLVTPGDVELARRCGMDPRDVSALRQFASERFVIVVRCPRTAAGAQERARRTRRRHPRPKTGAHRVVVSPRPPAPPPVELMSVWKVAGGRRTRVHHAARDASTPDHACLDGASFEATMIVLELGSRLVARVVRACEDGDPDPTRGAVAPGDRFVAFGDGGATYLPDAAAVAEYSRQRGLHWSQDR